VSLKTKELEAPHRRVKTEGTFCSHPLSAELENEQTDKQQPPTPELWLRDMATTHRGTQGIQK
jgi:hypothetical protein